MNISTTNIKTELEDPSGEVDVARERFESALLELLNKEENSDSDNGSDSDHKDQSAYKQDATDPGALNARSNSILSSRPLRKRRRKEAELHDGGFHHTFVMRMFDRSVDLAQFEESSPLYPICRAWMLNQPHNSDLSVKQEAGSPFHDTFEETPQDKEEDQTSKVISLPNPEPWIESDDTLLNDARIPKPLQFEERNLNVLNLLKEDVSPALLLTQHLHHWRNIRNQWKVFGQRADARYIKSYSILKAMFERECVEKTDFWNPDERKDASEEAMIEAIL